MADGHLFGNILLGGRVGADPGQLRVHPGGITWRKEGGTNVVEVDKADITGVTWMRVPQGYQLEVRIKDDLCYQFIGFREQDVVNLTNFIQKSFGRTPEEKQLSVIAHTWGDVDINGNVLTFLAGSKQAFEISLANLEQA